MNVLIDSDILTEVFGARISFARSFVQSGIDLRLWHSVRPAEEAALEAMFSALICVPVNAEVGRRAGDYLKRYSKSHSVEIADGLIAATAAVHKAALWTRNRKYYPMRDIDFY